MFTENKCSWIELEEDCLFLENVMTQQGCLDRAYLGPGGVYVVFANIGVPSKVYEYIRQLLGVSRVRLYFTGKGEYNPSSGSCDTVYDEDKHNSVIYDFLYSQPRQYSEAARNRLKELLLLTDAKARKYFTDDDGTVYLFRNGEFNRASELDSDFLFKLSLYGGVLGLHRFAMGKWFTGLFYALTGGCFVFGWAFDLLQFFFGTMKDNRKNTLRPLSNRKQQLRLLPLGLFVNTLCFIAWFLLFNIFIIPSNTISPV